MNLSVLKSIYFGESSASAEFSKAKELFESGFIDINHIYEEINFGKYWLVLGSKGSGKSMIGRKMLADSDKMDHFVRVEDADVSRLSGMINDSGGDNLASITSMWKIVLYSSLIELIREDQSVKFDAEIIEFFGLAEKQGLISSTINSKLKFAKTNYSLSPEISVPFFKISVKNDNGKHKFDSASWEDSLRDIVLSVRGRHDYRYIIDGLDRVLNSERKNLLLISALIHAVEEVNYTLFEDSSPCKVILLCRSDLYLILEGNDLSKTRQDWAKNIYWHRGEANRDSRLFDVINARIKISYPHLKIDAFFKKTYYNSDFYKYLLEHTRYVPRDLVVMMNYIKNEADSIPIHQTKLKDALTKYAREYFLREIRDELNIQFNTHEIDAIIAALRSVKSHRFTFDNFSACLLRINANIEAFRAIKALYECGGISMFENAGSQNAYYAHYNRNEEIPFYISDEFGMHRSLMRALNIPFGS